MAAVVEGGPIALTGAQAAHNMSEYEALWAHTKRAYVNAVLAYDSAETFFKEGGSVLYVGRVVGPGAVTASVMIPDNVAANTLQAQAKGPGDYGNDLNVVIRTNAQDANIPVGSFRVRVQTDAAVVLEESYDLLDDQAAIVWGNNVSKYIKFVDQASTLDPVAGTYSLASGTLDSAGITDTQWLAALDRFTSDLGPGQVFAPGRTTSAGHIQIANHALANNRIAVLDGADTAVAATLIAMPAAVIDSGARRSRFSGIFAPWLNITGLTGGTFRVVPPSPAVAGLMARNDAAGRSPNDPSAGERGIFNSVLSLTQSYIDADREALNTAGVNIIRDIFGTRKVYGYRTTADPVNDARWVGLGNSRLHRAVAALAYAVGERFIFRQIDGQGRLFNEFGGSLIGEVCMPFFLAGSLYGESPQEAFSVNVGPTVNTTATIEANEIHAVITLRMSPFGEEVTIEIVKLLVSETITA
jgi:hypothetical protein